MTYAYVHLSRQNIRLLRAGKSFLPAMSEGAQIGAHGRRPGMTARHREPGARGAALLFLGVAVAADAQAAAGNLPG